MVDVIKRRTTGLDDANDDGQVEVVMVNISPASFSTGLPDTTAVTIHCSSFLLSFYSYHI